MKDRLKKLRKSFRHAFSGLRHILTGEPVFEMMLFVALIVIFLMFFLPTTKIEKLILLITIFGVLGLELLNTIVERILNFISSEYNERVKEIKDLMAGIVLCASIASVVIGVVIFSEYLF